MFCIKNQSIGVSYGALLNLFQIFDYLTTGLFAGPLSADFWDVKKVSRSVEMGILNFESKICRKVWKYVLQNKVFFCFGQSVSDLWLIE